MLWHQSSLAPVVPCGLVFVVGIVELTKLLGLFFVVQLVAVVAPRNPVAPAVGLAVEHNTVGLVALPTLSAVPHILDSAVLVHSSRILQYHHKGSHDYDHSLFTDEKHRVLRRPIFRAIGAYNWLLLFSPCL